MVLAELFPFVFFGVSLAEMFMLVTDFATVEKFKRLAPSFFGILLKCISEAFTDHAYTTSNNHSPVLCIPVNLLCPSLKYVTLPDNVFACLLPAAHPPPICSRTRGCTQK